MSVIKEYLGLIPKGLPNSIDIIKGIINNIELNYNILPENIRSEIIRRRIICETCPFNSYNAKNSVEYKSITGKHYKSRRKDLHCSFCGCPIDIRTSSMSVSCGIEDWNDTNNFKLDLKWKAYESL